MVNRLSVFWGRPGRGLRRLVSGLAEQRCAVCGLVCPAREDGFPVCAACFDSLPPRRGGYCPLCGEPYADETLPLSLCGGCLNTPPPWQGLTMYAEYRGLLRELVQRCKFGQDGAATRLLALLLASRLRPVMEGWKSEGEAGVLLVPMPLHPARLRQRGANQCIELARALGLPRDVTLDISGLERFRVERPQRGLSREERLRNVAGAFRADGRVAGRRILLVDDVMTTGATMRHAAQCLLDAGAGPVHCAVVARVERQRTREK